MKNTDIISVIRYVWLDMNTGKFSNSWDEDLHKYIKDDLDYLKNATDNNYKLIKYECVNDPNFELYNQMKLR